MNSSEAVRNNVRVIVVGGGPAGCMAALFAREAGAEVLLLEANPQVLEKAAITGNGRCNLSNLAITPDAYHTVESNHLAKSAFLTYRPERLLNYFTENGIYLHTRGNLIYPQTDRAETIVLFLKRKLQRNGVVIRTGTAVTGVNWDPETGDFLIRTEDDDVLTADRVVLATGGLVHRGRDCGAAGYTLAKSLGHHLTATMPALTYLTTNEKHLAAADGVRCEARLTLLDPGKPQQGVSEQGELQITKKGLSGIAVFQLSHAAGTLLREGVQPELEIDFLPGVPEEEYNREIAGRIQSGICREETVADLFLGILQPKAASWLIREAGEVEERKVKKCDKEALLKLLSSVKHRRCIITGTGSYPEAQVTAGGVQGNEVTEAFESVYHKGLYFAGELLDVDGPCGGYNLTFAMCSGAAAGAAAAGHGMP